MHKLHKKQTYQCLVKLPYPSIFLNENCEIYEYQHLNQVMKTIQTQCPFCQPDNEREIILETQEVFAIYDKFPVNPGHALIIPKIHQSDFFDLNDELQNACFRAVNEVKKIVSFRFQPQGFNVGINVGVTAGQTIPHVHIHLIPRYSGDVEKPRGGVRGVIPSKQSY